MFDGFLKQGNGLCVDLDALSYGKSFEINIDGLLLSIEMLFLI